MNTPVNFEIAKLLKEKGFDNPCENRYNKLGELTATKLGMNMQPNNYSDSYSAPTIAEVIMWLYEKHGIWIEAHRWTNQPVDDEVWENCFQAFVNGDAMSVSIFKTPTEAYEAGIEYIKENNLI